MKKFQLKELDRLVEYIWHVIVTQKKIIMRLKKCQSAK